ncbi:porin [Antarcticibacterium arcticum]|uniref:Porin n=1 Tax=Antarcticibacterium arcticum TaxID=2585771 RepID=A0A5B8YLB0_9FLAO|nr:porin [Antarcticibacterium arcticum]QED37597.1 porin [Antarcticibacterium arcticum]
MKLKHLLPLALSVFLTFSMQAQDITENRFGKGLVNVMAKDSSYSLVFAARFQSLYSSQWEFPHYEEFESGDSNFLIRRARLKFDGFAFSPKLVYKLEVGLSNRDISGTSVYTGNTPRYILDAVLKWNFFENFELWAGQTKLPGNRERVISSANLETVDRSLVNSRFNIDRDMGLQLHHSLNLGPNFLIREAFAFSQGEGRNISTGNLGGYQYTGRIEALPLGDFSDYTGADLSREETPKLAVGFTYDHNANAVRTRSNSGTYMVNDIGFHEADINTIFLDAMFKYQGWSVMVEYADRTSDQPIAMNSDGTATGAVVNVGDGFNILTGYVFKNNFQVTGRYTTIELEEEITGAGVETQYTLGFSKYLVGHKLKVQTDVSLNDYENNIDNSLMYRFQIDFHF